MLHTENQRIAAMVCADLFDEGVAIGIADQVGRDALGLLDRDRTCTELFVMKVQDHTGTPHACVTSHPTPDRKLLFRLPIGEMRKTARRELIADLRFDLAWDDDGTEI